MLCNATSTHPKHVHFKAMHFGCLHVCTVGMNNDRDAVHMFGLCVGEKREQWQRAGDLKCSRLKAQTTRMTPCRAHVHVSMWIVDMCSP